MRSAYGFPNGIPSAGPSDAVWKEAQKQDCRSGSSCATRQRVPRDRAFPTKPRGARARDVGRGPRRASTTLHARLSGCLRRVGERRGAAERARGSERADSADVHLSSACIMRPHGGSGFCCHDCGVVHRSLRGEYASNVSRTSTSTAPRDCLYIVLGRSRSGFRRYHATSLSLSRPARHERGKGAERA